MENKDKIKAPEVQSTEGTTLTIGTASAGQAPEQVVLEKGADAVIASTEAQMETFLETEQATFEKNLPPVVHQGSSTTISSSKTVMDFQDLRSIDKSLVAIKADYQKDYEGHKYLQADETYYVSKEQAAQLVKEHKAKIVK